MVPCPLTMMVSSLIAGTYAPPAVQEPITQAIWAMPAALIRAWLRRSVRSGRGRGHLGLVRQVRATTVHQVDAGQAVLQRDLSWARRCFFTVSGK